MIPILDQITNRSLPIKKKSTVSVLFAGLQGQVAFWEDINTPTLQEWEAVWMVALDTSTLLFWTLDPGQLSPTAEREIEGIERVLVSPISVWEVALKAKRGKLVIPLNHPGLCGKTPQDRGA